MVDLGYHYPAVDGNGNPISTEVSGTPDYISDANGNGLLDQWETTYLGGFNYAATDLDSAGNTLLYDYQNNIDPNAINFTASMGNQNFNVTNPTGSYQPLAGLPGYESVLVNDTNLNDAVWQPYDGTVYLTLGPTDGVYQVWLGLKGPGQNAQPVWFGTDVTLNRQAPQIVITSPVTNVVATPYIQVQGYAALPLAGVTFDESNAVSFVTNQPGNIIAHTVDTNLCSYTTDYFQCYDILLTNGVNAITLHCTDPAGNTTNIALNITLDYRIATNPVIALAWPTNGMEICQSNFTLRGWTEDASATVTAQITDTNGDTNVMGGIVERTGVLWVNNLPLAEGTNTLTLTVTNSAGLSSETNIMLVKSDMVLVLTNIAGDLWLPTVNVSGLISDTNAAVWVNGVQGTSNGDGTWSAANVPVPPGGVASFDLNAIPAGGGDPGGNDTVNKANETVIESDVWTSGSFYTFDHSLNEPDEVDQVTGNYTFAGGGLVHEHAQAVYTNGDSVADSYWVLAPGGNIVTNYTVGNGPRFDVFGSSGPFGLPAEIGSLSFKNFSSEGLLTDSQSESGNVHFEYLVGGTGVVGHQVLLEVAGTDQEGQVIDSDGANEFGDGMTFTTSQITDGDLGEQGSDGWAVKAEPAGSTVEITPAADPSMQFPGVSNAGAPVPVSTTLHSALTDTNLHRLNLGVGEQVTLSFNPPVQVGLTWTTTAGGVDHSGNFTAPSNACSATVTATDQSNGAALSFPAFKVFAPSAIDHAIIVNDYSNSYSTGLAGAGMDINAFVAPTTVSFYRVCIMEIPGGPTNVTGSFTNGAPSHTTAGYWGAPLANDNHFQDTAASPQPGLPPPWIAGGFDWVIPSNWHIQGSSVTNTFTQWTQSFRLLDSNGDFSVSKFGQTVTRTTNNVITEN